MLRFFIAMTVLLISTASFASPVQRLAEAVRIQTISYQERERIDYAQFQRLNDYLRVSYPLVFARLQVETVGDYSLLLRWPGSDDTLKPILFTAHTDVVPVEPGTEDDWEHPAFAGVVADGRIYGRGTLDDKLGVMGLLEAAEQLLAEGFVPRRGIVFAFGHDEEISGEQGAASLAARMRELRRLDAAQLEPLRRRMDERLESLFTTGAVAAQFWALPFVRQFLVGSPP